MSQNLSPRVRQMRDALKRERLAREEQAGARTNPASQDPWLAKSRPDDLDPQVQGVTDQPAALPSGNSDPFALPDPGFGPLADSQAAAGSSLHDALEHASEDDSLLEEALERSLQQTRTESGPQAERTRRAAASLAAEIKDKRISDIAKSFVALSKQQTGTEYCADDESLNFIAVLEELNRQHNAGVYIDPDDTDSATVALFAKGKWTVSNLLAAWKALVERGDAPCLYEGARPISASERRSAQVRAASGDIEGAIISLLQVALPSIGDASSPEELLEIVSHPANRPVILDAVLSCWLATSQALVAGARDNPETRAAIANALGPAPVTVDNVRAAFEQVKRSRRPASLEDQHAAAINRPPSVDDLESMGDQEISDLLSSVVRDRTRRVRRGLL